METMYVTAFTFGKDGWSYPRRVEIDGISYVFQDRGLRITIKHGATDCKALMATDGKRTFHLRGLKRGSVWSLVKFA